MATDNVRVQWREKPVDDMSIGPASTDTNAVLRFGEMNGGGAVKSTK